MKAELMSWESVFERNVQWGKLSRLVLNIIFGKTILVVKSVLSFKRIVCGFPAQTEKS